MNISKKQKLVYDVIQMNPGCQNNDADLIAAVWKREGFENMYVQRGLEYALNHVTRSETITRRRRELYNMGLIEYSEKALDERTEAFKQERDNHSDYEQDFRYMFGKDMLEGFPEIRRTNGR